ncbi:2-dehydro-3-deoxy-D-gluconate 5-dehydrogenase [Novipirellula galeiformis]|uniref:2-dehydro-3-deoxy-D-gluconate 5-dehydrogenase n=1 Tax=Novipirellula galeiformis TaxID=2528004 RepID=A0A5C6BGU0_9BACT|nr:SDR family oxidoreductase [Novipirellula galeiformis]TWU11170.1 2-dehydro-3-deoxy-D-gluconate 5-dehydrogenase [Novipirellula galeiformis]
MPSDEPMRLNSKRALVTGAGKGIGRGCALELARAGADLILNDRPGSQELAQTADDIRALGRQCWTVEADVFSPDGCAALIQSAIQQAGEIDILISNPAYGKRDRFLDFSTSEFDKVIDATFKSGFHIAQAMARHRVELGGGGKILFITSVVAEMPFEECSPYSAAKAALNQLTQCIAVELFSHRINVNAIEPGWIDTPNERVTFSDDVIDSSGASLPWGRLGTPADIGRAATFLVSDAADYITGTVLPVDGGFRFKDMRSVSQLAPKKAT